MNIALSDRSILEQLVVYLASYGLLKKPDVKISENELSERERERDFFIRRLEVQIPMNTYNKSQIKDSSPDFPHRGIVGQITGKQSRYNLIA